MRSFTLALIFCSLAAGVASVPLGYEYGPRPNKVNNIQQCSGNSHIKLSKPSFSGVCHIVRAQAIWQLT